MSTGVDSAILGTLKNADHPGSQTSSKITSKPPAAIAARKPNESKVSILKFEASYSFPPPLNPSRGSTIDDSMAYESSSTEEKATTDAINDDPATPFWLRIFLLYTVRDIKTWKSYTDRCSEHTTSSSTNSFPDRIQSQQGTHISEPLI